MEKNIPTLRFPEFEGEWDEKTLGELSKKRIIKNVDNLINNVFTNSARNGIVNQRDYFDKDIANQNNLAGYYVIENNDFIYNPRISSHAPVGPISRNHMGTGVMSPLYSVFRFHIGDLNFFECFFDTTIWHNHMEDIANFGARADRMSFLIGDFYQMPIPFPSLQEQTKIASFLTSVDDKLSQLKKKKELLERYKKGVMQKLFSQELRFKDENGEDYAEWEEKKLGDVVNIRSGLSKDQNGNNNGYKVTRIETISAGTIDFNKIGYIDVVDNIDDYKLIKGDILFSNINSVSHIGKTAIAYSNLDLYHGMNLLCLRGEFSINSLFLFYYLNTVELRNYFKRICNQAVSQASINQTELAKTELFLPSLSEQTKIANFLSAIDEKIQHNNQQIAKMESWKKGLLQQMFV